jgi:pimeloyl-ACP methyl ester carboxylesterase
MRLKNRIIGVGRHPEPMRHFGPGGVDEAEQLCLAASADFLGFLKPPAGLRPDNITVRNARSFAFDSPLPSGFAANDRVAVRIVPAASPRPDRKAIVFHHALMQKHWPVWEWFVAPLARRFPVVILAAPYHFDRTPKGQYPSEGMVNPNPWRLFEALRQWSWDHKALMNGLPSLTGLEPAAVIGFSLGAFQSILAAASGELDGLPLVAISSTNRYAHGLFEGALGSGTVEGMRRAGLERDRLERMVEAIQLERYAPALAGRPVLYIAGRHDRVDPAPSGERLERALSPRRSVWLEAGHATVVLRRDRVAREILEFFDEIGVR